MDEPSGRLLDEVAYAFAQAAVEAHDELLAVGFMGAVYPRKGLLRSLWERLPGRLTPREEELHFALVYTGKLTEADRRRVNDALLHAELSNDAGDYLVLRTAVVHWAKHTGVFAKRVTAIPEGVSPDTLQ